MVVSQPTLRLRRRRDGSWNLEGLLADPWPGPWIETPPITIQNATLELIPDEEPPDLRLRRQIRSPAPKAGARLISVFSTGDERPGRRSQPPRVRRTRPQCRQSQSGDPCATSRSKSSRPEQAPNASSSREPLGATFSRK